MANAIARRQLLLLLVDLIWRPAIINFKQSCVADALCHDLKHHESVACHLELVLQGLQGVYRVHALVQFARFIQRCLKALII